MTSDAAGPGPAHDPLVPLRSALEDIEEWLEDHAPAILENLNDGASEARIRAVETNLGLRFPEPLRELYRIHDGQRLAGEHCFFEHMAFLDLEGGRTAQPVMLRAHFGLRPDGTIDPGRVFADEDTPLHAAEYSPRWFPFANTDGDYLAVSCDTGRVFRVAREMPALTLVAPDVATFVYEYAARVWDDVYVIAGDPALEGVAAPGVRALKRYLYDDH
jgi:cell wall assembly regulator SMI1